MEQTKKKAPALKRIFQAFVRGELLISLHLDKYFMHIIYTFFLVWFSIWLSLKVESTLVKVEEGKKALTDIKIYHTQKAVELESLNRLSTMERLLEQSGSPLVLPDQPATIIKNNN